MSGLGVFAVDRGIFDHPRLTGEPYTKVQAFMWLVAEAAWKPHRRVIGGVVINLLRGQAACSVRFMAKKWDWTPARVQRFLATLKTDTMIDTATDTGLTIVAICKYDVYQRVSLPSDTPNDTSSGTPTIQQRYKREDRENKEIDPSSQADASDTECAQAAPEPSGGKTRERNAYPAAFEQVWAAYPTDRNMSKAETFKAWSRLEQADKDRLFKSIPAFKIWISTQRDYRTVHFERYIKWRRFDGFAPEAGHTNGTPAISNYLATLSDDRWRAEVRRWRNTVGAWDLARHTPTPDDPETKVPASILAEFGIVHRVDPGSVTPLRRAS
jgi:hypothetical protein